MDLTQESIISLLVDEGGKIEKSDLAEKFSSSMECVDPEERGRLRELFKTLVNDVAFVKEIEGVRYVLLKKKYRHLLRGSQRTETCNHESKQEVSGEPEQSPCLQDEKTEKSVDPGGSAGTEGNSAVLSPIFLALQRSQMDTFRMSRMLNFEVKDKQADEAKEQSKPFGLPLRVPPSLRVEIHRPNVNQEPDKSPELDPSRSRRKPSMMESHSPLLRRAARSSKVPEEPKDSRMSSMFPMEQTEHEWLVKCAAGHWSQVHGLLLSDCQLAEKKDFMSGFTVLHWAAKCGNSKILSKVMDLSRERGVDIDINAKSHGGYTPLHIAALHDQEYIMAMLVGEFGANVKLRDNCGKRAYHYLHKGISKTVKEMLRGAQAEVKAQEEDSLSQREEQDFLPDLSRGLHSISRLFQPAAIMHKKKHGQRSGLYSLSEDPKEEQEDSAFRHRAMSNASVC
ncbi:PREDICTED: ankyrin repeat domain-containing protein SOWAHA-like [Cyprinodon variegatus]|uniref:ankyrin repeat domain-containing protein SOWAHA-like n=1 Tax=Cyprinodon variegatus TaxID=28743 RepID=UPI00074266A2|nr:PREDICTED: ankyrin repeat domain-containing protein SOWAHA-like [Cyprinodon variegatus]